MKKYIVTFFILLAGFKFCQAQSSASPGVTIGSSYTNTSTYVNVFPYQSGTQPKIDKRIHFKLNIGTKFKINDIKDSSGTILGYIITPWKYDDALSPPISPDTVKSKKIFYDKIIQLGKIRVRRIDSIAKKQVELKKALLKLQQDSLKVLAAKDTLIHVQKETKDTLQRLFTSAIALDPKVIKSVIPKNSEPLKKKMDTFLSLQNDAKSQINNGHELDSNQKVKVVNAAFKIPLSSVNNLSKTDDKSKNRLNNATQAYNDLKDDYEDTKDSVTDRIKTLVASITKVKNANGNSIQSDPNKPDRFAYKITKKKINDSLDSPSDTTNQAALLDELAYLDSWANGWLFFIPAQDFSQHCVLIYPGSHQFTWGFLTLPVKMRFDNGEGGRFDFEQNLNFGLTFGDKHQLLSTNDVSLNYLLGLSIVNVPLNNATPSVAATSTAAVSTSIGIMLQYNKFQIGAFFGRDYAGSHANQFDYQGKPWLGFAIGISLFGEGKTTSSSETQQSGTP